MANGRNSKWWPVSQRHRLIVSINEKKIPFFWFIEKKTGGDGGGGARFALVKFEPAHADILDVNPRGKWRAKTKKKYKIKLDHYVLSLT